MRAALAIVLSAFLLAFPALGQEAPGADLGTPVEETIITVTATRIPDPIPEVYVPPPPQFSATFTAEEYGGRTVYTYRRELYDFGNGASVEFYRRWNDGQGTEYGIPEERETRGRLVFRF